MQFGKHLFKKGLALIVALLEKLSIYITKNLKLKLKKKQ
jgi:hypothetical protein